MLLAMQANPGNGEGIDARVRRRLRELRTEQGLTLQQVSERAHIDISMLSRLESGKRRLALDHIPGLAAALGVSTDDLLGGAPPSDPRVRSQPVKRDGLTMWPLTNRGQANGLRAFKIRINAGRRKPPASLRVHDGHDWMYVIDGGYDCSWASRTSSSNLARRSSSARGPRTGSGRSTDRWN